MVLPYDLTWIKAAALLGIAFLAGFVDSIAGGGGLIQLPGIMNIMGNVPVVTMLSINKNSSFLGTCTSMIEYIRRVDIDWKRFLGPAAAAFCCSLAGAFTASRIDNSFLRPLIIVLLGAVLVFNILSKGYGEQAKESRFTPRQQSILGLLAGAVIGFYDGFFGPGTGTFLIMAFIAIYGMDFLHASAGAKIINASTNLAALLIYLFSGIGNIFIGCLMGVFNLLGAKCGVKTAVLKGNKFVRVMFMVMSAILLIKQIIG